MRMTRLLIVNADDFGLSAGVNRGIIECAARGILTSASLMVRWPAAAEAAAYARTNTEISVGLHVDLGEWVNRNGNWEPLYRVADIDDPDAVRAEVEKQLSAFRRFIGRDPTHMDSHQHVHREEPVRSTMSRLAHGLGVPLRECDARVRHCGSFYGQDAEGKPLPDSLCIGNFRRIIEALPAGTTELGCHPGYGEDLQSPYRVEREQEVRVLCDPTARAAVESAGIVLASFHDVVVQNQCEG